ncbi:MAG: chemotaxis protein CheW [Leptospiraceae bacterium]|nr:chemotaxis protein CheW [Leptospiraceae bacterium]
MQEEELKIFINESYETLNSLDKELVTLGKNPENGEILNTIHANYQTFLESSRFLKFSKLESLTHIGERLINQLIRSDIELTGEIITTVMKLNSAIREIIFTIEETGKEPGHINASIISDVEEIIVKSDEDVQEVSSDSADFLLAGIPTAGILSSESDIMERLLSIVVEMFHTKESLTRFYQKFKDLQYYQVVSRLSLLINDVYDQLRYSRTQPIGTLVMNLDKIMKDEARNLGKSANLRIIGKDKLLDTRIIEGLRVCLIQVIKNSIEHGVESTDERLAADKPPDGAITIECNYRGELFHISIVDDGKGIDPESIRKKLIEKNLILTEEAENLSDSEIMEYIFKDGYYGLNESGQFLGGKPTGFDILKAKVETMGGGVYLEESMPGKGTEIQITLPMVNAIVPIIVVSFGTERYAIAKNHIYEVLQTDSESLLKNVETILGFSVFKRRGKKYPLLYMKQIIKYEEEEADEEPDENPIVNIVILENGGLKFGLVADKIQDLEHAVIRALNPQLSGIYLFSGVTILQDDKPALILDIGEIRRRHMNNKELIMEISTEEEDVP